jgi:hypothetical protein
MLRGPIIKTRVIFLNFGRAQVVGCDATLSGRFGRRDCKEFRGKIQQRTALRLILLR